MTSTVLVSDGLYIVFVPVMTILAFLVGTGLAFLAMSGRQEPADGEAAETEAAH